jgi:hypothetical protein
MPEGPLWHDRVGVGGPTRAVRTGTESGSVAHAIRRTQALVLGFFAVSWVTLATALVLSPSVQEAELRRTPGSGTPAVITLLAVLLGLLTVLGIGVVRRWRWLFWLLMLAFAFGLVRVPVAVLELSGRLSPEGPDWYVVLQGVSGVVQAALALVMFADHRRPGAWGASGVRRGRWRRPPDLGPRRPGRSARG